MSKKRRKARAAKGKGRRRWYPFRPAQEELYLSVDTGPITFVYRITGYIENTDDGTVQVKAMSIEDSIRPVELKFPPPLLELGRKSDGFDYKWQQLTYLFEFVDPAGYPTVTKALSDEDRQLLMRYVETCRHLAAYTVISSSHKLSIAISGKDSETQVQVELPSHEEFVGFSATFRQLHNDGEEASFNKAWKIVNKATSTARLSDESRNAATADLQDWRRARSKLKTKPVQALIAEKLKPNMKEDTPRPLQGIVPETLIKTFNYGDTLHWGSEREKLAELTSGIESYASYHKYCCVSTMTTLSHLYFGFAELVAAALGETAYVGKF